MTDKKEDKSKIAIEKFRVERDAGFICVFVNDKLIMTVDQNYLFNEEDEESNIGVEISTLLNYLLDEVLGFE